MSDQTEQKKLTPEELKDICLQLKIPETGHIETDNLIRRARFLDLMQASLGPLIPKLKTVEGSPQGLDPDLCHNLTALAEEYAHDLLPRK